MCKNFFSMFLAVTLALIITSCKSDNDLEGKPAKREAVKEMKDFLNGDVILGTHATINGVNKTLTKNGAPVKYNFTWNDNNSNSFTISILDFHVGAMPFTINYKAVAEIMELNSFEKQEYKGDGWIKFKGENGHIFIAGVQGGEAKADGSFVQGYYNLNTKEINFIIDFNLMNVRSECYKQTIDKSRLANYEAEKAQFEKDLEAEKAKQGLN